MADQQSVQQAAAAFDPTRKYVRVCTERPDGFVEFEFAIGDPALCVELMLPTSAFHDFCTANEVVILPPLEGEHGDWAARLNEAARRDLEGAG
jgi:phenol hydroxylase P0 protein